MGTLNENKQAKADNSTIFKNWFTVYQFLKIQVLFQDFNQKLITA